MQELYKKFDAGMKLAEIDYIVTCTYRDNGEQQKLYDQGRTTKGSIVTNAKPGQSKHNCVGKDGKPASQAFDICIMKNGKLDWDVKNPDWQKAGKIGREVGLEWAGDWRSFKEFPHFQQP
jgi:peptidoglycan L-alanyl-D-glutamate endopeptidase CwlK